MRAYAIIALVLLLGGCSPRQIPAEVRFCPYEDCLGLLVDALNSAEHSIGCAFYDLNHGNVTSAILTAHARNVSVRLVLDRKNEVNGTSPYPLARTAVSSGLMHHKFCVIDDTRVISGSMNPTERGIGVNHNNVILFESKSLAKKYGKEFEELWEGEWPGKSSIFRRSGNIEVSFCPEDLCQDAIIDAIREAESEVRVMAFTFTDVALGTELILAQDRGVSVTMLFDVRQNRKYSQLWRLRDQGIETRRLSDKGFLHHKVWVIDNTTVITGSFNPSWSAIAKNEENLLIIQDRRLAARYLHEFAQLWEQANP